MDAIPGECYHADPADISPPPAIAGRKPDLPMHDYLFLIDVLKLLLAAVVLVPLGQRLGIPSVLSYLIAGVVLGPYTPGPVVDAEATRPLAEFGVVFLLFAIGLELSFNRLKAMRRHIFGLGLAQLVFTGLLFLGGGLALGRPASTAVIVGGTLALSSTATVLALLVERNEAVSQHGRATVAVLIFQDLAVVPLLTLLPLLAEKSQHILPALGLAGAKAAAAILVIFLLGRIVLRPAYRFVASARAPEVFSAANLLLVLAVGVATEAAGMSMALGAFLAGLLLADSPYRHQVETDIQPFRGLLLGLFFMNVGMSIDLPFALRHGMAILVLTAALIAGKALVLLILGRLGGRFGGLSGNDTIRVALMLAQGGEFAFVVFDRAMDLKVIDPSDGQSLMTAVALSMALTPLLSALATRLVARNQRREAVIERHDAHAELSGHVVIAGYGRVGRTIASVLRESGLSSVALDCDAAAVIAAHGRGETVFYGDASQDAMLKAVGVEQALAAVVTVNNPRLAERTVAAIRRLAPALPLVARAHDRQQQDLLLAAGASAVIPETVETSLQMAERLMRSARMPEDDISTCLGRRRQSLYSSPGGDDDR